MQRKLQQGKGARRGGGGGGATGTSTYYAALLSRARNVEDMILLRDINIGWLPADYFYNCSVDNEPHAPLSAESQKGESNNNKDRQGIVHETWRWEQTLGSVQQRRQRLQLRLERRQTLRARLLGSKQARFLVYNRTCGATKLNTSMGGGSFS